MDKYFESVCELDVRCAQLHFLHLGLGLGLRLRVKVRFRDKVSVGVRRHATLSSSVLLRALMLTL